jgi:asparaginyl-tRNA synthetase
VNSRIPSAGGPTSRRSTNGISARSLRGPVFITDYPKEIKAFLHALKRRREDVAACDLLVPGIVSSSAVPSAKSGTTGLVGRMAEMNIPAEPLKRYI